MTNKPRVDNWVPPSWFVSIDRAWPFPTDGQYHCWRNLNTSRRSQVSMSLSKKHVLHMSRVGNFVAISSSFVTARDSLLASSRVKRTFTARIIKKRWDVQWNVTLRFYLSGLPWTYLRYELPRTTRPIPFEIHLDLLLRMTIGFPGVCNGHVHTHHTFSKSCSYKHHIERSFLWNCEWWKPLL